MFQVVCPPFNWIDQVIGEIAEKLGQMLSEDAAQGQMLARKNPW
jgi:hypothetical protein